MTRSEYVNHVRRVMEEGGTIRDLRRVERGNYSAEAVRRELESKTKKRKPKPKKSI